MAENERLSLGALIRTKRMARGWTQKAMGKSLQKSNASISEWESDKKRPSARSLPLLAAMIGVDPEQMARMIATR